MIKFFFNINQLISVIFKKQSQNPTCCINYSITLIYCASILLYSLTWIFQEIAHYWLVFLASVLHLNCIFHQYYRFIKKIIPFTSPLNLVWAQHIKSPQSSLITYSLGWLSKICIVIYTFLMWTLNRIRIISIKYKITHVILSNS